VVDPGALLALVAEERVSRGEVAVGVVNHPKGVVGGGVIQISDPADPLEQRVVGDVQTASTGAEALVGREGPEAAVLDDVGVALGGRLGIRIRHAGPHELDVEAGVLEALVLI
jgi:hypothetical protein